MKTQSGLFLSISVILILIISGCKVEEPPVTNPVGEFTCLWNGTSFKGKPVGATMFAGINPVDSFFEKTFDFRVESSTGDTLITFTFGQIGAPIENTTCPLPSDTLFDNWVLGNTIFAATVLLNGGADLYANYDGYALLTLCDYTNNLANGKIECLTAKFGGATEDTILLTNGLFKNVSYTLFQ